MSKYDDKDCTGWDLSDRTDMNGLTIHGLCLSNETPNAKVLPPDLKGVTFERCNLDNVFVPAGNILKDCSNRLFQVQNDGEDWHIDPKTLLPTMPINSHLFLNIGLSIDPLNIPKNALELSIVQQTNIDIENAKNVTAKAAIDNLDVAPILAQSISSVI